MSKLHEILAVEESTKKAAQKLLMESIGTFDKNHLFKGSIKTLSMFKEEDKDMETEEKVKLETTVMENIDYIRPFLAKHWDVSLRKDLGNQLAKADLVVDGEIIAQDLPATFLLSMENKLQLVRKLVEKAPTLPSSIRWTPDVTEREWVYITMDDSVTLKTQKDIEFRVVVEGDAHHPAQVREVPIVKTIGKYTTREWSGALPPVEKGRIIAKIDTLLQAVKKARMRANEVKVENVQVGSTLLGYIFDS